MKYKISDIFPIDANTFIDLYFNEELNAFLDSNLNIKKRELLNNQSDDKICSKKYKVYPERTLPGIIKTILKTEEISYIEKRTLQVKNNKMDFEIIPCVFTKQLVLSSQCIIEPLGEDSVKRNFIGEIIVKIPVIGPVIEKFIVDELLKSFKLCSTLTNEYINKIRNEKKDN